MDKKTLCCPSFSHCDDFWEKLLQPMTLFVCPDKKFYLFPEKGFDCMKTIGYHINVGSLSSIHCIAS